MAVTQPEPDQISQAAGREPALRDAPLEICFLCSANRFRSALAGGVASHVLRAVDVRVASFGAKVVHPGAPLPVVVKAADALGVDLTQHRARSLRPGVLADSALVLGFERWHLEAARINGSALPERTFLLTELSALLDAAGASLITPRPSPQEIVARLEPARRLVGLSRDFGPISDPATARTQIQEAAACQIVELVLDTLPRLFGESVEADVQRLRIKLRKLQRGPAGARGGSASPRAAFQLRGGLLPGGRRRRPHQR